jgi:transcriptional regulator of nitric oxide reductase
MLREFEVECPECRGWILVDLDSGEVLAHGKAGAPRGTERPKPKKLEDALERLKERQDTSDEVFRDAVKAVEKSKKKLDAAFEAAKKKAKKNPDEKPRSPFDDLFGD